MVYIRYEIINDFIFVSVTMDFWSNYISQSFQFCICTKKVIKLVLVVVVPIIVVNEVRPFMPLFWIPHINNTNSMFIQYLNFEILVYIPTTISLCNHMSQFKITVCPVVLLSHVGKLLLKMSITDMYAY